MNPIAIILVIVYWCWMLPGGGNSCQAKGWYNKYRWYYVYIFRLGFTKQNRSHWNRLF